LFLKLGTELSWSGLLWLNLSWLSAISQPASQSFVLLLLLLLLLLAY
jgi:hypothetical protein